MPDHRHVWGDLERSHLAGTVHRKCLVPGCSFVNALDDPEELDGVLCEDCVIFYANGDTSGMTPEREAEVLAAAERQPGMIIPNCDSNTGEGCIDFSSARCMGCGTTLGGGRHSAVLLSMVDDGG